MDSDLGFGSTFKEREDEDKYFSSIRQLKISDQIRQFPDNELNQMLGLRQSRNHFNFPDRKQKSFAELDREYFSFTQLPDKKLEKMAQQKYTNLYNMYNLPYQTVKQQNADAIVQEGRRVQFYTSDKPAGPINENWVTDDSQERQAVGERYDSNDNAHLRIDGSLIDATVKKTKIVFKNYS